MRKQEIIELVVPLKGHGGKPIKRIVIREPTFDEYLEIGDPQTVAMSGDGTPFAVENSDVIKAYLAVCLVEPKEMELLSQAGANVAREVKQRLLGFFRPASKADEASETSETNSPSAD